MTRSYLDKIMEHAKLGISDYMYLEDEKQLEIEQNFIMMYLNGKKTTSDGRIILQRKVTPQHLGLGMFKFAFTITS